MRTSIVLLLGLALACARAERDVQPETDTAQAALIERDERQFQNALRVLRDAAARAESVTIYHVANEFDADYARIAEQTKARFARYPVRAQITATKERISPLVNVLADRNSYFPPGEAWSCIFEPRHIVHVASKDEAVTAVVCIACGDVELIVGNESIGTHSVRPAANGELARLLASITGRTSI